MKRLKKWTLLVGGISLSTAASAQFQVPERLPDYARPGSDIADPTARVVQPTVNHMRPGRGTTNITISSSAFSLRPGQQYKVTLPERYYIEALHITTEGTSRDASKGMVIVNGKHKGNFFAPGNRDPYDPVTVGEDASEVVFIGAALPGLSGTIRVTKVTADVIILGKPLQRPVVRRPGGQGYGSIRSDEERYYGPIWSEYAEWSEDRLHPNCYSCRGVLKFPSEQYPTRMGAIASMTVKLVVKLGGYTQTRNKMKYLDPILKAAARARAQSFARRSDAGEASRVYYKALLDEMDAAEKLLNDMFEQAEAFYWAQRLLNLRELTRATLM